MDTKTIAWGALTERAEASMSQHLSQKETWDIITELLGGLSDKQLSNLVLVIREVQVERENDKVEAATVKA
jgi:hypothetical protein